MNHSMRSRSSSSWPRSESSLDRLRRGAVAPGRGPDQLNEWGLAGRGFGTFVSWFLLGGDIYTAYTFIAVPALVYATGAAGFYAWHTRSCLPDRVHLRAAALVGRARPRLRHARRVRSRPARLAGPRLAVAVTGILATMPYIALQLVGIESVLTVVGIAAPRATP